MPVGLPQMGIGQQWGMGLLQGQSGGGLPVVNQHTFNAQQQTSRTPSHQLTIYMQDFRNNPDCPEHYLAELQMPLTQDGDQWWVSADEMIRKLQGTPGRIDGMCGPFTLGCREISLKHSSLTH